jgi:hypothetical protein
MKRQLNRTIQKAKSEKEFQTFALFFNENDVDLSVMAFEDNVYNMYLVDIVKLPTTGDTFSNIN